MVHVAWEDVRAYATWAGRELPTEAEWELACRGGLDGATYAWGEELNPEGRWMANTWQGEFPLHNTGQDGYEGTAPVGRYPPNGYGLLDMIGNVWDRPAARMAQAVDTGTSHLGFRCILRPAPGVGSTPAG